MNKTSVVCQATAGKLIKLVRLRKWLCENNPDEENTFLHVEVVKCHVFPSLWTKISPQG